MHSSTIAISKLVHCQEEWSFKWIDMHIDVMHPQTYKLEIRFDQSDKNPIHNNILSKTKP